MPTHTHNFVASEAISHATYNDTSRVLTITFRDGWKSYAYYNVPPSVWIEFIHASSAGRYVQYHIKPYYSLRR
ncbi:KTSC domain-containing protein [Gluconobacter sp. R71646]|uniref:KTSC domain-containing protein n=1 Tax=Gluconobacter potus TaxID=2724927 RepID=A0ABR9YQZ9_9PROT|nr:KTSC domain-containing protein [Gluconobacter sp. R71656]MBF0868615.1 KTSC domain-containing protein [Gluconobacter sp. R75628]MBF0874556.1 KTSC domain-containing protein [Gluconobacter sp. R75629]MBF0883631.1 KTSC domain-containing protein [Gluconobacter potus]